MAAAEPGSRPGGRADPNHPPHHPPTPTISPLLSRRRRHGVGRRRARVPRGAGARAGNGGRGRGDQGKRRDGCLWRWCRRRVGGAANRSGGASCFCFFHPTPHPSLPPQALTGVIKRSKASTMMGLERELKDAAATLERCNPTALSLRAGCELFLRFATRTSALEMADFAAAKAHIVDVRRERKGVEEWLRRRPRPHDPPPFFPSPFLSVASISLKPPPAPAPPLPTWAPASCAPARRC